MILNGYLRLYCKIKGVVRPDGSPLIPERCRECGGEVDERYKARHRGYQCRDCFNKEKRDKNHANTKARIAYPIRQLCSIEGCRELGQRHHDNYDRPLEIVWLCPKHHKAFHLRLTLYDTMT